MITSTFITGSSDFVSLNLITMLRTQNLEVRALATSDADATVIRDAGAIPIAGNLDDENALQQGMESCDVVFHTETMKGAWGRFEDFHRVNVLGTENVIRAAKAKKVSTLIYNSTEATLMSGKPLVNVDESQPRPAHPLGMHAITGGMAEELVLAANEPTLSTMVIRSRLNWGPGDTTGLPQFVAAARAGKFAFINGGHHLTSTCHVTNVCEGLLLAAQKGQGGEIYFISDGSPIELRSFITAWLSTAGVEPGDRNVPLGLAKLIAGCSEFVWNTFHLKGSPPLTRAAVQLLGEEVTVNDTKARRDLGYVEKVSREQGLAALQTTPLTTLSH